MKRAFVAVFLLAVLSVPNAQAAGGHQLQAYLVKIRPQIHVYRGLATRFEALLLQESVINVDPVVEKLYRVAELFDRVGARCEAIKAPAGIRLRHRGMTTVFSLFADAIRIHADALFTRHPDELAASTPKVKARLRSAAYLQKRWAAALQGALVRARLTVPKWLHQMATLQVA
jgi:hypothetical protein